MKPMKNITLEISLKPFRETTDEAIEKVCREVFLQWRQLVKDAECVSVMLWASDGSEILEYRGDLNEKFEWAYLLGTANGAVEAKHFDRDPNGTGLHTRPYFYMKNPPVMTYGILKKIVSEFKRQGHLILGEDKKIRVGETFDIGPEFAVSDFKYKRHNEICEGAAFGMKGSTISATTFLHADELSYAGFPDGIPEGTPFGTFFGRQCQVFLPDMGFDYIWFSNGLGFGRDVWSSLGAIFDGETFHTENIKNVKQAVVDFWTYFRKECPDYPIETRGTNMSLGIDCSTDGVPLKMIYDTVPGILPPPNSPWAALDGDFGLELMGYMSRVAEVPNDEYLFRYYIHDPWWVNSPWYDRYNNQPHDIYLPLACARIDKNGEVKAPTHMSLLSIDTSFGKLPDSCANETIPHLLRGLKEMPDEPSPAVWVYPFREYSDATSAEELRAMYNEDWFIRGAVNCAFPLSTVTSTDSFLCQNKNIYRASVLITPVPYAGSEFEKQILDYAKAGNKVIFYGSLGRAGKEFLDFFRLTLCDGEHGEFALKADGKDAGTVKHDPLVSGGELNAVSPDAYATVGKYAAAVREQNAVYLRATVSADLGGRLLEPHDEKRYTICETLLCDALCRLGWEVRLDRKAGTEYPKNMIHRHDNAYIFSVYTPSTTVKTLLKTPLGAPILDGYDTVMENGYATYYFPKAEHRECRVFVEQESGIVGVKEMQPVSAQFRRRIELHGLQNATVRFFPENYAKRNTVAVLNTYLDHDFVEGSDPFDGGIVEKDGLCFFEARGVTGQMIFSLPYREGESPMENDGFGPIKLV